MAVAPFEGVGSMAKVWEAMEAGALVTRPLTAKLAESRLGQGKNEAVALYREIQSNLARVMAM